MTDDVRNPKDEMYEAEQDRINREASAASASNDGPRPASPERLMRFMMALESLLAELEEPDDDHGLATQV